MAEGREVAQPSFSHLLLALQKTFNEAPGEICKSHPFKHNLQAQKYKGIDYTVLDAKAYIMACGFNKQINVRINYVSYSVIF